MVLGLTAWIALELLAPEGFWPPQLVGVLVSLGAMVLGSLMPQWGVNRLPPVASSLSSR